MRYSAALAALLFTLPFSAAQQGAVELNELFGRAVQCNGGQLCGYYSTLCCAANACYTDTNNQASCSAYLTPATAVTAVTTPTATAGYWTLATATYTTNGFYTVTSTYSTYIGGAVATGVATGVATCDAALNQQSCGNICCGSNQYCSTIIGNAGSCAAYTAGSSGYMSSYTSIMYATTDSAGVPLRPTASTLVVVTVAVASASATVTSTASTATTEPFQTPVVTGSNVTFTTTQASTSSSGLSGGAIAGIVIGVLLALFILGLICFYCCLRGIFEGCLALCGLGRKRERKEVDVYERRTHHSSGGGGRTWYGAARPNRQDDRKSEHGKTSKLLGIGAGLAALWAILGLKRRNERRNEEKQSEYSYYSSDYYTSESSASSDRRTRDDRRSRR